MSTQQLNHREPLNHTGPLNQADDSPAVEWAGLTWLRAGSELLLGLSFFVAVSFGFAGVVRGEPSLVAQLAGVTFLCALVVVLVNWFTASTDDSHRRGWEY